MAASEGTAQLEERIAKLTVVANTREKEIKRARRSEANALSEVERLNVIIGRVAQLRPADKTVPTWVKPKKKPGKHVATPVLMLSDLHLDEVVSEREMDGLNVYNREIAEKRLDRVVNKTIEYLRDYVAGVGFDGIVVPLIGDIITGAIHEELAKTNEAPVPATIAHWVPLLASALTYLADEFGNVFVPCVDGNHDRTGKRIQYKNRAEESFAWIVYHWLADTLRDDERIVFNISQSGELHFPVYDTNLFMVHGDAVKGGSGIGGIWPPIMRYVTKKQDAYAARRSPFDYALLGHWHQLTWGQSFIINGSMKGYDEYARGNAFKYERPQQGLFLVTPENGITLRTGIFCD